MSDQKPIEKVRISYVKSKDHRIIYADSALIGQSSARTIIIDFFVGNLLPLNETHTLSEDKKTFNVKIDHVDINSYERIREVEVIMTPENADILADAIKERVKSYKTEQPLK